MLTAVERVLAASLGPERWDGSESPLLVAYATAPQHVGRDALFLSPADLDELREAAPGIGFDRWTRDDAARALLLIAIRTQGRTGDAFVSEALACFEQGDAREQQSWLRAIALWPEAKAFLPSAIDACRTNIIPVFEALACENPYPAAHFPDRNFNQMVLKAMFNSIALERISGLQSRLNPELSRMARDYAAERTAAGRMVPPDIDLVVKDHE
ncbi:MAG TPA: EboA domain-containing protein [Vicinamibacterales bacterium]|nr:EboA domain-containing protein [Vicinamibacterales bacterium]